MELIPDPPVLIMDEPTSGLDSKVTNLSLFPKLIILKFRFD
jgi:ABC-type multidrug transport system ATPase subunit